MNSLGIKEYARDFPLGVSDDLLDFELDGDGIGGDTKKFNLSKGSSSDNFSGCGDDGGGSVKPADQEEELEWLRYFPEVEDNILFDKPGDIGLLGEQHSPVSVLENNSVTNNQTSFGTTIALKVPTGFPDYVRKKRVGRKRRSDGFGFGQQHKHLFLEGVDHEKLNPIRSLKIVKKNRAATTAGRRCLHCGSDKTPQWRTGPLGKKTLCNACGVRYKSGRLVPEYRPANSPTFMPVLHSNSHRKIMEMRKMKQEGIGPKFVMNGTF